MVLLSAADCFASPDGAFTHVEWEMDRYVVLNSWSTMQVSKDDSVLLVSKHLKFSGDGHPQVADSLSAFKVQVQCGCPHVVHARNLNRTTALQISCQTVNVIVT